MLCRLSTDGRLLLFLARYSIARARVAASVLVLARAVHRKHCRCCQRRGVQRRLLEARWKRQNGMCGCLDWWAAMQEGGRQTLRCECDSGMHVQRGLCPPSQHGQCRISSSQAILTCYEGPLATWHHGEMLDPFEHASRTLLPSRASLGEHRLLQLRTSPEGDTHLKH